MTNPSLYWIAQAAMALFFKENVFPPDLSLFLIFVLRYKIIRQDSKSKFKSLTFHDLATIHAAATTFPAQHDDLVVHNHGCVVVPPAADGLSLLFLLAIINIIIIISSVRSSYSHPDLLVTHHHPLFQITPVLNTGLSLSEPLQLYKGYNAI